MAVFSDFEGWAKNSNISEKIKDITFSFKLDGGIVVYEDNKNSKVFMLSKALFLKKNQPETKNALLEKFLLDFRTYTGVVSMGNHIDIMEYKPLLIKIPREKIKTSKFITPEDKQRFQDNLKTDFSFLNNSSIWVRVVDEDDTKAENKAQSEFGIFAKMKLYEYGSARENFDFNCRIQSENWLKGDHGHDVTPILYGNESDFFKKLFG